MSTATLYEDDTRAWGLLEGDALSLLGAMPARSVDAIVTDPPYNLSFKGQSWDGRDIQRAAGDKQLSAAEAFQRWTSLWASQCRRVLKPGGHLIAFGAPRTFHRLASGIEDGGLALRDTLMWLYAQGLPKSRRMPGGLGTGLKPGYEPILLARAGLDGSTVQGAVDTWGTGALNIEAARIGEAGYWPANVALSHSPDCPAGMIDGQSGGPSRLFFCAKAPKAERDAGCEQLPQSARALFTGKGGGSPLLRANIHPTVKPLALMRWLVRLVTPSGGVVLDPFTGSGTTGVAAVLEGRTFLGVEREGEYVDIACARLTHWAHQAREETT
jgi:site-specific DNA-methyltransferase (adenine-specific)